MKAILIRDCEGPNPEWKPPRRADFPDADAHKLASLRYQKKVPHTIKIPKGTVIEGEGCWKHCLPDAEKIVRAAPADEECAELLSLVTGKDVRPVEAPAPPPAAPVSP